MENKYLELAYKEAQKAVAEDEVPVGCVIVKNDKIIATSHNLVEKNNDITFHAEIIALKEAFLLLKTKNLEGCKIYITLEPCLMCLGAIINAHIKEVYFASLDKYKGAFTYYNVSPSVSNLEIHYLEDIRCASLLSDFFTNKR